MPSLVTLTTDFAERDPNVAALKGILYSRCPGVQVVDLSHDIPRRNIMEGALFLAGAVPYFPDGTIHLAVVAPGAQPIAVSINRQIIVCPNNGLITILAERYPIDETRAINDPGMPSSKGGQTFFGRDVFAPAAALLASGSPLKDLGDSVDDVALLALSQPVKDKACVSGKVMHVDGFGNLITNIHQSFLDGCSVTGVEVGLFRVGGVKETYAQVPSGSPVALYGSSGYLEIAYNGGRAEAILNMGVDIVVEVSIEPEKS